MKAKVNLYNRNSVAGRIDTYQFTPYSKKPQETTLVDREDRLSVAYTANYDQACLLLQAIQANDRRRLSSECILQLAAFVANAWESEPSQEKIDQLAKLMSNLLDTTLLCPDKSLDEALKQFCLENIPTHSVSPSITLLIAIGYIDRLKQKYHNIKGTTGCGNRLILVAYMMAAKFIHVNLKSIINTTTKKQEPNNNDTPYLPSIKEQQLPSPPTSPKSDTDPLNYHYFSKRPPPAEEKKPAYYREHHYQILRMELEFLHFLNYDLSVQNTVKLIHWAQNFDDNLLPPIKNLHIE